MSAQSISGKFFIQLEGETVAEALESFAYASLSDAMLDAHDELPPGTKFTVLEGSFQDFCAWSGWSAQEHHLAS